MAEPLPPISPAQLVTLRAMSMTLTKVSLAVVAIGVVACVDALCRAFFGTAEGVVGWIPYANNVLSRPIHKIEQKVSNFLGGLEEHIDANVGFYIHALAINVGRLADGSAEAGWSLWLLGKALGATRAAIHALPSTGSIVNRITHVTKIERVVVKQVTTVGKLASHAYTGVSFSDVKALEGELSHVVEWDIPRLWRRTRVIQNEWERAWKWIRTHPLAIPAAVATALTMAVLRRAGVNWIRCSNWKRLGSAVCRLPLGLIEELLSTAIVAFAATDICDFANAAETLAEQMKPALLALVDVEDALVGCHGATKPPALPLPALRLPANSRGLQLAA